jgi:hypothetical protein
MVQASPATNPTATVYYDGACPVCSREIAHYQRLPGAQACQWVDAAQCPPEALGPGLARAQALVERGQQRLWRGNVDGDHRRSDLKMHVEIPETLNSAVLSQGWPLCRG